MRVQLNQLEIRCCVDPTALKSQNGRIELLSSLY